MMNMSPANVLEFRCRKNSDLQLDYNQLHLLEIFLISQRMISSLLILLRLEIRRHIEDFHENLAIRFPGVSEMSAPSIHFVN